MSPFLWGRLSTDTYCLGCAVFILEISKSVYTMLWALCSKWSCFSRWGGQDDIQRPLPTSIILWLNEKLHLLLESASYFLSKYSGTYVLLTEQWQEMHSCRWWEERIWVHTSCWQHPHQSQYLHFRKSFLSLEMRITILFKSSAILPQHMLRS